MDGGKARILGRKMNLIRKDVMFFETFRLFQENPDLEHFNDIQERHFPGNPRHFMETRVLVRSDLKLITTNNQYFLSY